MSDLRLVVFDVDGTLIDSQHAIFAGIKGAFAAVGRPMVSRGEALSIVGLSLPVALATLAPDADETELAAMVEGYRTIYLAGAELPASPLYPGARAVLERLAAAEGMLLGIATGKSRRGLDRALVAHDLGHFFATTQVADDHPSKPHPSMLEATLAETGAQARQGVMIGDTEFDIAMGRAAGFATIGVTWGYHRPDRLRAAGADVVINDYADLAAALESLHKVQA